MNIKYEKYMESLKGKKVCFIGAGVSHKQLIRQFAAAGAEVTLRDMKDREGLGPFAEECDSLGVRLTLGEGYLDGLSEEEIVFRSISFLRLLFKDVV